MGTMGRLGTYLERAQTQDQRRATQTREARRDDKHYGLNFLSFSPSLPLLWPLFEKVNEEKGKVSPRETRDNVATLRLWSGGRWTGLPLSSTHSLTLSLSLISCSYNIKSTEQTLPPFFIYLFRIYCNPMHWRLAVGILSVWIVMSECGPVPSSFFGLSTKDFQNYAPSSDIF